MKIYLKSIIKMTFSEVNHHFILSRATIMMIFVSRQHAPCKKVTADVSLMVLIV